MFISPSLQNFYLSFFYTFFLLSVYPLKSQEKEKSNYHLFKPVPKKEMRAMHTDRPDITETPFTVDAGHFQFEYDFLNFYRHPLNLRRNGPRKENDFLLLNGISKVGITDFLDFEVLCSMFEWHIPDFVEGKNNSTRSGFGDFAIRSKLNLVGNSHEQWGLAIMPSLTFPTRNSVSEGLYIPGISIIWAVELPLEMELGGQFEYFKAFSNLESESFTEFWGTIELGKDINQHWSTFIEYVGIISPQFPYTHTLNGGIIYKVNSNFHLDMAMIKGLNPLSPNSAFTGFSYRF